MRDNVACNAAKFAHLTNWLYCVISASACRHHSLLVSFSTSLLSKSTVNTTTKSFWCKNFCQNEIFISCQSFTCFNKTIGLARQLICWQYSGLYSVHALAAKQPRLKSRRLQSVVSNAGEGLQRADRRRRRTLFTYPGRRMWTGCYWYGSQAVTHTSLCSKCPSVALTHAQGWLSKV